MSTENDSALDATTPAAPNPAILNQMPVVSPDGTMGVIPHEDWTAAEAKGFKRAVFATSPEGKLGVLHPEDAPKAIQQGFQLGQATPQTDAVLQDPRMGESRTDMLKRTVVQPFKDEMAPKSAWEEIKRDVVRGLNPLSNPVVQAAGNLVTEGGQKLSDLIAHEWEGVPADTTIGKLGKNYLAPAAETAATGVLAPMAQPESIATMGAFKAPVAGTAGRLIRAGTGLAFGVPALRAAVKSGAPAVQAAAQGNTPEAVRLGTQAAFDTAMAAETLGGVAREAPATAKETAQLATNKAPYWLAKRLPESLLTPAKQVAVDVRQTQDQGANLAAGLETGGSPTSKSVQTYEDVAQPILPDIRAEAARQGVTEKDFEGRKGYDTAKKVTAGVRESYDDAYKSLLDPLRGDYAGEAAKRAAGEVADKMLGDSSLMDEIQKGDPSATNVRALQNLRDTIANARTIGQLDDIRLKLNKLSGKYEAKSSSQQHLSALTQETLHEGANSIRNALYGEMERLYGGASTPTEVNQGQVQNPAVQSGVTESQIRELQRNHGAAIQADDLMKQTARNLSSQASAESALPSWWQRVRGNAAPLEIAGRPKMAATGFMKSVLGFKPPDATEIFNTRMKRVIKGAAPDEGMDFPKGATTPEYVEGRSEGPTSSRVPGLALPAPTPFADSEVVGPRGPRQLEGTGIDQRALPAGSYEQPPSWFTPKPKALPPATLPAENAPRTNRVEAVGVPETAEASALQNRFEQKPQGFTPPKRPFFMKGDVPRMPTGRPLTPEEIAVQQQPGTTGVAKDIGNWQPPPELGAFSAPDYGQKARTEVESKMGGPLKRNSEGGGLPGRLRGKVSAVSPDKGAGENSVQPKQQTPADARQIVNDKYEVGHATHTDTWIVYDRQSGDAAGFADSQSQAVAEANRLQSAPTPAKKDVLATRSGAVTLYRGEGGTSNRGGAYWSPSKEFAAQFTQTGRTGELRTTRLKRSEIYEPTESVYAGDPDAVDKVTAEARSKGFRAVRLSEGGNEPDSVYVIPKSDSSPTPSKGVESRPDIPSKAATRSQSVPAVQAAVKSQSSPAVGSPEYEDLKARVAQLEQKRSGKGIVGVLGKKAEVAKPESPAPVQEKSAVQASTDKANPEFGRAAEQIKPGQQLSTDEEVSKAIHGTNDAQVFRDGAMMENGRVGKNAHDFGRVASGLANVLETKGIKASTNREYWKQGGGHPLYWELSDLFHNPLASMNPKMSVPEIGKAMDSVLPSEPIKVDERGYQFKTSFDMGRPADSMAKDLKEGRFASEIKSAEDNAAKMRRKADIVQSLIGETENVKKARAAADATEQRVNEIKNRAQERIDAQQEKDAEAARALKERPMTLAKNIQPFENATWTPKTAWDGNMMKAGENTPWITDGHAAINLDFAERKAANMAGERKFSAKVEKMREPYPHNGRPVSNDNVKTLVNAVESSASTPGEILGFHAKEALYGDKGNGYGTAYIENTASHKIIPVQASILKMVMDTMKPDAIKVGKPSDAVAFYRDGKIAAVVMPLRTEAEFHVATAKKTLADLRAQQPEPKGKHFLSKLTGK